MYYFIFLFLTKSILSLPEIIIYEDMDTIHSKDMERSLDRGIKNSVLIKKYDRKESVDSLIKKNKNIKLLIFMKIEKNNIILNSYNNGKKFISYNRKFSKNIFYELVSKIILLYDLESVENIDIFESIDNNSFKSRYLRLNDKNYLNMNPLNYALHLGKFDLIEKLLGKNIYMYEKDYSETMPLHRILKSGNLNLFKKYYFPILKEFKTKKSKTYIHFAAESGNLELVKYLKFLDMDINEKTENEESTLHFAAKSGNIELINYLLEKSFDLTCITKNKKNILHFAFSSKNIDFIKKIISLLEEKNFDIEKNKFDKYKNDYIHYAVLTGDIVFLEKLEELGYKIQNIEKAMYYSIYKNNMDLILKLIKDEKIDILKKNSYGYPILHMARYLSSKNFKKIMKNVKLEDIEKIKDDNSLNIMNYTILGGKFSNLVFLKKMGLDINYITKNNENLLYFAMIGGHKKLFFYLMNIGVNVNIRMYGGNNLLHLSVIEEKIWFYDLLRKNYPKLEFERNALGKTVAHIAIEMGNLELLKDIISRNGKKFIYYYDNQGNDLLKYSLLNKQYKILDFLLSLRPILYIENSKKETLFDLSFKNKDIKSLKYLLKRNPELKFKE